MHFIVSFLSWNKTIICLVIRGRSTMGSGWGQQRMYTVPFLFDKVISSHFHPYCSESVGVQTSDWRMISEHFLNPTVLCKSYQVFLRDDSVGQDNMKQLKWQRLQKARTERGRYEPFYKIVPQWPKMEFIASSIAWLFWPKMKCWL